VGKSRQWVTLATALINAPDWLLQAYREGRCRGMAELYELRHLDADDPGRVQAWAEACNHVSRDRLATLRAALTQPDPATTPPALTHAAAALRVARTRSTDAGRAAIGSAGVALPAGPGGRCIHVEFNGEAFELDVTIAPAADGQMYVKPLAGGQRRQVRAADLRLRGFAPP
jgi:ParB family transcriptional regulator, chromosome partitioning protein